MKYVKSLSITFVFGLVYFYFALPPINITSISFWSFVIILLILFVVLSASFNAVTLFKNFPNLSGGIKPFNKVEKVALGMVFLIIPLILLINMIFSPFFMADAYSKRILIDETHDFTEDVKPLNVNNLPVIDKDSSLRLGDRTMGRLPDLVSQFNVSSLYTQISYKNEITRVTPLEYSDIFKYINNRKNGTAGYIKVNSVTGESELTRLEEGLVYLDSAFLKENLTRKLRFSYPTKIFGDKYFELDDESKPYWIVPTIKYVGVGIRPDVEGVIVLDPVTGNSNYYNVANVPEWVDHVYPSSLILDQVSDWGAYRGGFWNSLIGQKNVVQPTQGYNYTIIENDVYLYTGITSVVGDESNIGFILSNLRTKETNFYSAPGAEEYSAMASAEGQVQQMNYVSTFPLLVNLNGRPTYFLSLKDRAGLVKMYAFVDVTDYQRVVVTESSEGITKAVQNYIGRDIDELNIESKEITIGSIQMGIIDGNTFYFIEDENNDKYFVSITIDKELLPFAKVGDMVEIGFYKTEGIIEILQIK